MSEEAAMREALALARRGRGRVEPNPRVGAVALSKGVVVGRGYHPFYGGDHAEVMALGEAAALGRDVDTLVVTLEPCSSALGDGGKKTPPCTEAVLGAGVRKVIIGNLDPDTRHHMRGVEALRKSGVEVEVGELEQECRDLNRPFARWLQLDVPWVIAKWAMSLDGKIATPSGDSQWISGEASRTRVHQVRAECDGVMIGFRTAVVDDPELTVRHVAGPNPPRIVVDPAAELPTTRRLVQTAKVTPTICLVAADAAPDRVEQLRACGVEVVVAPGSAAHHEIDLTVALRELRQRGMRRILVEGGGGLMADMFAARLVHQVMVFLAPMVLGGTAALAPVGGTGVPLVADAWRFGESVYEASGEDVLLHAFVT